MKKLSILFLLFISSIQIIGAKEVSDYYISSIPLHLRVSELINQEDPFVMGDSIIFSYYPGGRTPRHVGISFMNENFTKVHNMHRNGNGVYFFVYKFPEIDEVKYKFIEDGIWVSGKRNIESLASYTIPSNSIQEMDSPVVSKNIATFRYRGKSGEKVFLTGDFNGWDPFLYPMKEGKNGIYSISLTLPEGTYGYYFISNGERILDSENFIKGYSSYGEEVSLLTIDD